MKQKQYTWILYIISCTVAITIMAQAYWNYKNYQQNKQVINNEIQLSLDNSIEIYFSELSKNILPSINNSNVKKVISKNYLENPNQLLNNIDSFIESMKKNPNTITKLYSFIQPGIDKNNTQLFSKIKSIVISVKQDSINYIQLDSILKKQLQIKKISSPYYITHTDKEKLLFPKNKNQLSAKYHKIKAKSTFLRKNESINIHIKNPTRHILKRGIIGILLSTLFSILIIGCIYYLMTIISKQKQLNLIKNDLISNITHEFKTPITTISTALEALNNFNALQNKEKTTKYIQYSKEQLNKLELMVEKLLETASLDSNSIFLKKEYLNGILWLENIINKHKNQGVNIEYTHSLEEIKFHIDPFHFENVINNILDNAIKYGGDKIEVHLKIHQTNKKIYQININDNGTGISKQVQQKVFDKFYRIPTGNTHNIKGFGIGLYYAKNIIEKHKGNISLTSNTKQTSFKITMPNDK